MLCPADPRDGGIRSVATRFGIVTPVLNGERFIEQTLRSIWRQRDDEVEIDHVIVDGGSNDRTLEIASRYPSQVVVSTDDQGMYDAVNRGMSLVDGDIVGYINADDEIAPGALRVIHRTFTTHADVQWLCGRLEYIDASGSVLGRLQPVPLTLTSFVGIGWSCIPQQTVWARRSFFERVGPFDLAYRNCGDYDWYARALKLQRPYIVRATLGRFRLHPGQISLDMQKMNRESSIVAERHGRRDFAEWFQGRLLSLRLNASNPTWFLAKKRSRIVFTPN
jgi:glycosyltransferase involved in cell wall biosynthesis